MGAGFTVQHKNTGAANWPGIILVSNYDSDNEVVNWLSDEREGRTKSDIGLWKIRYKKLTADRPTNNQIKNNNK
ncbi:hypothetical protein [Flavobacterium sp.]